jgi:hypothetical protein
MASDIDNTIVGNAPRVLQEEGITLVQSEPLDVLVLLRSAEHEAASVRMAIAMSSGVAPTPQGMHEPSPGPRRALAEHPVRIADLSSAGEDTARQSLSDSGSQFAQPVLECGDDVHGRLLLERKFVAADRLAGVARRGEAVGAGIAAGIGARGRHGINPSAAIPASA